MLKTYITSEERNAVFSLFGDTQETRYQLDTEAEVRRIFRANFIKTTFNHSNTAVINTEVSRWQFLQIKATLHLSWKNEKRGTCLPLVSSANGTVTIGPLYGPPASYMYCHSGRPKIPPGSLLFFLRHIFRLVIN